MTPKAQELYKQLREYAPPKWAPKHDEKTEIELAFEWTCEHLAAVYERLDSISGQVSVLNVATSELAKKAHRAEQPAEAGNDAEDDEATSRRIAKRVSEQFDLRLEQARREGYEAGWREGWTKGQMNMRLRAANETNAVEPVVRARIMNLIIFAGEPDPAPKPGKPFTAFAEKLPPLPTSAMAAAEMPDPDKGWRCGRKVGRTLYKDGQLVGLLDTREMAAQVVATMNRTAGEP